MKLRNEQGKVTYAAFAIASVVVLALILVIVAAVKHDRLNTFLLLFAGYVLGLVSATIARPVYPPPQQSST